MFFFEWFSRSATDREKRLRPERLAEITSWLRHPVSTAEALNRPSLAYDDFKAWLSKAVLPGDELWWYDTAGDSWENLCGENGFAVLRGGNIVEFYMVEMN